MSYRQDHFVSIDLTGLRFFAAGKSGAVYYINESTVLKEFHDQDDLNTEKAAFELLGDRPNIVKCLGQAVDDALVLERGEPLRPYLRAGAPILSATKVHWINDVAKGMQHMHDKDVVHADIGCHNLILINDRVKLIDFEGCSCRGKEPMSAYEWYSYPLSSIAISQQTDIFAFGCAVYEIVTGNVPHQDLECYDDRRERAAQRYAQGQHPDVERLPFAELMRACWSAQITSADDIVCMLQDING